MRLHPAGAAPAAFLQPVRSANPTKSMENHRNARFDRLEALIEKGFADIKAELKDMHRQGEAKDTRIAAFLERMREYATPMRSVVPDDDK